MQRCEKWLQKIAEKNPAGISDQYVNAFREGYQFAFNDAQLELTQVREELQKAERDIETWRNTWQISNEEITRLRSELKQARRQLSPPDPELVESFARQFHEAYERLAPTFGYETRPESAKPWPEVPENNRKLMIAVCDQTMGFAARRLGQLSAELHMQERQHEGDGYTISDLRAELGKAEAENKALNQELTELRETLDAKQNSEDDINR